MNRSAKSKRMVGSILREELKAAMMKDFEQRCDKLSRAAESERGDGNKTL